MSLLAAEEAVRRVADRTLGKRVVSLRAWPHPYATSHDLVAADLGLRDGRRLRWIVKDGRGRSGERPRLLPRRADEATIYAVVLGHGRPWTPRLHGVEGSRLVLERVAGVPLWQSDDASAIALAARAARALHGSPLPRPGASVLLRYDRRLYERWLRRAIAAAPRLAGIERLVRRTTDLLLAQEQVVVHGELYPSNVLVGESGAFVIDWETAAIGPAVVDLAALVTGWPDPLAAAALHAYGPVDPVTLDCARLHLALRWVGCSRGWTPPAAHRHDWCGEAELLVERLGESM